MPSYDFGDPVQFETINAKVRGTWLDKGRRFVLIKQNNGSFYKSERPKEKKF